MKENNLKNKIYYSSETGLNVRFWNYDFYESKGYQDKCEAQIK